MIKSIPGWSWEESEDGGSVTMRPQGRPDAGSIRYVERVRPLRPAPEVARAVALPDGAFLRRLSEPETMITAEGEYGAIAVATIGFEGRSIHRVIGMVFGDDFHSLMVGQTSHPELVEPFNRQVAELVRRDSHMLGVRRRRFRFDPPPEWDGFVAGMFHAHFHPPDFPRDPSSMIVYPALPLDMVAKNRAEMPGMLVGDVVQNEPEAPIQTRMGLAGSWWRLHQPSSELDRVDVVLLEDNRYLYPVILRTPTARGIEHVKRMQQLVQSIEPIPNPASWFRPTVHAGRVVQWLN